MATRLPELTQLKENILKGNLAALSKAITLTESRKAEHRNYANKLLQELIPNTGNALRIGITGIPGVGKSTFIEALGLYLISLGHKIAVLAIDPSSHISHGSILGDKTRMEELSKNPSAFIRPSPSSGTLGGVSSSTFETVLLCEASGYDIILIETVGVGQSEITVSEICDCFLYLTIAFTGDELQGIKRGIMEMADVVFINKVDEKPSRAAIDSQANIIRALKLMPKKFSGWDIPVILGSAIDNRNIDKCWNSILDFFTHAKESNYFYEQRKKQFLQRFEHLLFYYFMEKIKEKHKLQDQTDKIKEEVESFAVNPSTAAEKWINEFF
ncbi:MAG: methylmalonyl Co-A mutase-associated GTPase MeaB [Flavobacteriaceae bacterium]|jgi:LAO/AO transport system kinase|nr:methylmalonyl Co-A mutase-associated GTPase MeaB [Flavobacteriaceae bacterium]